LIEQWHFEVPIQKKKKKWRGKGQRKNTVIGQAEIDECGS
jgi:hypothetical protein